ncbi:MAG: ATP-binding protein [Nonomuraea sp.]|nr:ATP-binding protein [Nonomuraea sp.]
MGASSWLRLPITGDLATTRERIRDFAEVSSMSPERIGDLILAVNEGVTNVLDHAGGRGELTLRSDDDGLTVVIADDTDLLTSAHLRREPGETPTRGMGLWIIQQLCDLVTVEHTGGRSVLSLYMRHAG